MNFAKGLGLGLLIGYAGVSTVIIVVMYNDSKKNNGPRNYFGSYTVPTASKNPINYSRRNYTAD